MLVRASPRGFSVDVRSDYTRISRGSFTAAGSPSEMSNVPEGKKETAIVLRMCSRTQQCVPPSFFSPRSRLADLSFSSPAFPVVQPRRRGILMDGELRRLFSFLFTTLITLGCNDAHAARQHEKNQGRGKRSASVQNADSAAGTAVPFSAFVSGRKPFQRRNPAIQLNARLLGKRN